MSFNSLPVQHVGDRLTFRFPQHHHCPVTLSRPDARVTARPLWGVLAPSTEGPLFPTNARLHLVGGGELLS
jgi:hypothetical protein